MLPVRGVALLLLLSVGALAAPSVVDMQMRELLPARSPLALTSFQPYEQTWADFKATHGKTYEDVEEEESRFSMFMYNVKYIEQHNAQYHNGTKSYFLGLNQFAAMTNREFRRYNGFGRRHHEGRASATPTACNTSYLSPSNVVLPKTVDWRQKGYVSPVKNQGHCGSCWSFSTTGSVEGQHFRKTGHLVSLSEQQLVDCSGKFGNLGCNGGLMDNSFDYIMAVGGLETESKYPYKAKDDRCQFKKSEVAATVSGYVDLPSGDEDKLQEAVATVGPVSIAIDVPMSFMFYMGGVYDDPRCKKGEADLDHAVLVVGYGARGRDDYWLVKNSWGTTWGDHGYIMMSRNKYNQCGIATMASYPRV